MHLAYAAPIADQISPQNNYWGGDPNGSFPVYASAASPTGSVVALSSTAIGNAGGTSAGTTAAHDNMPPFTVLNYVIAVTGLYPARN
jgi:microcystin-dependent protein